MGKQISPKLKKELADLSGIPEEKITKNSTLEEDLGLDSLDKFEFVCMVGQEFDIEIPDVVLDKLETVGDYIKYIQNPSEKYKNFS